MTTEPSPPPAPSGARGRQIAIAFGIVVAVLVIYVLSLLAGHLLAKSAPALPAVDFSKLEAEDSVVQVHLEKLDTVANRLTVNALVYPKDSLYDKNFGVLTTDAAVRLYPDNDLGDLHTRQEKRRPKSARPSWRMAIPVTGRSTRTKRK
jgi:Domain of unknown function (DUF4436)